MIEENEKVNMRLEALTVEGNIEYIICLDEVNILIKELDALLVIQNAAA